MRALAVSALLILLAPAPALADGVHKDRERFDERTAVTGKKVVERARRTTRLTNMSPDYVGSHMGLGKPSYYGSRRPDPPEW
jgi:hypothetical protein